jgi:hypothetical protein
VTIGAALAGTGGLILSGSGSITIGAELSGTAELSDMARQYKHYEEFSNVPRVLVV